MKPPSKNMSKSLRGQSPAGNSAISVSVSKPKAPNAAGMVHPGEGGVENPPGKVSDRSAKVYARAVGKTFGGGS